MIRQSVNSLDSRFTYLQQIVQFGRIPEVLPVARHELWQRVSVTHRPDLFKAIHGSQCAETAGYLPRIAPYQASDQARAKGIADASMRVVPPVQRMLPLKEEARLHSL